MSEDSIFREVDEELRSERMHAFWRRFGPLVIGAAIAVVALVGVNEGWRWWKDSNSARSSDLLYRALELADTGDISAAQEALNVTIAEGSGDYPLLAQFRQAALLLEQGNSSEGVAAYDALAVAAGAQRLRELALVLAAQALVDSGDVAAVEARVGGIISGNNPFAGAAREALGLTQYKAGDFAGAMSTFEALVADSTAQQNQVSRVQVYIGQLVAQGASVSEQGAASVAEQPSDDS